MKCLLSHATVFGLLPESNRDYQVDFNLLKHGAELVFLVINVMAF